MGQTTQREGPRRRIHYEVVLEFYSLEYHDLGLINPFIISNNVTVPNNGK